ncbi:MAG: hypothetical protein CM15mP74_29170 [Halieaceae bacterium]|nr:MAG: hypothetical protein CM15mP74_29170 [Halieaceae bacterium]
MPRTICLEDRRSLGFGRAGTPPLANAQGRWRKKAWECGSMGEVAPAHLPYQAKCFRGPRPIRTAVVGERRASINSGPGLSPFGGEMSADPIKIGHRDHRDRFSDHSGPMAG